MFNTLKYSLLIVFALMASVATATAAGNDKQNFSQFILQFSQQYQALKIPDLQFDYKNYFENIPDTPSLSAQEHFFRKELTGLVHFDYKALDERAELHYDQLKYECDYNLQRIALEKDWVINGRNIPVGGLHSIANSKAWYNLFIQKFTSLNILPEELYRLGTSETERVRQEISRIQRQLGFADSASFYNHLQSDTFLLRDKNEILARYQAIDSAVRSNLHRIIDVKNLPPVYPMEWPNANQFTPPGMYLNHNENAYNKDVFQFNFYGQKHNSRAMEWLYMHEAIPGHHLQSTLVHRLPPDDTTLQQLFYYPGNFEGWACYVEYLGKDIGMYQNPYSELGKWEWDLVRSVRVVIDVGIHYYGWNYDKALAYWKANIPSQDAIAQREITRITNWPAQVLSYKAGANYIMQMRKKYADKMGSKYDIKRFHAAFLNLGSVPLAITDKRLMEAE